MALRSPVTSLLLLLFAAGVCTAIPLANPPALASSAGKLSATLVCSIGVPHDVGIDPSLVFAANLTLFNDSFVPPTFRLRPGEVLALTVVNALGEHTNVHFHGMQVSPMGHGDNVFVEIAESQSWTYEIALPPSHPPGLYYYHSHTMLDSEQQVFRGMSGLIIVEGLLDPFPSLAGVKETIILLKDIQLVPANQTLDEDGQHENETVPYDIVSNTTTLRLVNGMFQPTIPIAPDEVQLWRIANIGADIYYDFSIDNVTMMQIGRDGSRLSQLVLRTDFLLGPSARIDVLVRGPPQGTYAVRTLAINTGPGGDQYPNVQIASLSSSGTSGSSPPALPPSALFPPVRDLRVLPVSQNRTFLFTESSDGMTFFINGFVSFVRDLAYSLAGLSFNASRLDNVAKFGTVEQWTLINNATEWHFFHVHQTAFQVISINGVEQPLFGLQDGVNMPFYNQTGDDNPGLIELLVPFDHPMMEGEFVLHCHIMAHEDKGMMQTILVGSGGSSKSVPLAVLLLVVALLAIVGW